MVNIVVGGQMDKQSIAGLVEKVGGDKVTVTIKSDIEAALAVQTGQADFYIGACATGAGAALAMAYALVGAPHCTALSIPGKISGEDEIKKAVTDGKKAFGFVNNDAERLLPILIPLLIEKKG